MCTINGKSENQVYAQLSVFSYCEAELDRTQGNDKDAEEDGDSAFTDDLSRGSHDTGLPRTHLVPTPRVEKRFLKIPRISSLFPETHPQPPTNQFQPVALEN